MEGRFAIRDVKGLTPAIEPTVSDEIFALEGRNYVFDSRGVRSPFGDRLLSVVPLPVPAHVQAIRLRLNEEIGRAHV